MSYDPNNPFASERDADEYWSLGWDAPDQDKRSADEVLPLTFADLPRGLFTTRETAERLTFRRSDQEVPEERPLTEEEMRQILMPKSPLTFRRKAQQQPLIESEEPKLNQKEAKARSDAGNADTFLQC